ncbi:helicase-related protein [Bradyrhizobium sp. LLZ17]|uniref:Helicase-related protein n=1 Tax=Bradyrhizobium sp. LLZ17 TaxID=3239388 RepID=A0AB39XKI6_9BRAD
MTGFAQLRVLDDPSVSRELDPVSELFHRINRIIPEKQQLLVIPPETIVRDAIALLRRHGYTHLFGGDEVETTTWHRSMAVDHTGKALFTRIRNLVELIEFHESAADQFVREFVVEELAARIPKTINAPSIVTIFRRSLASSPSALEGTVRRLRDRFASGLLQPSSPETTDEDGDTPIPSASSDKELAKALDDCLMEIDCLPGDSKLEAFLEKFSAIRATSALRFRLVVLTEFRSTLFYLQAQLEELGFGSIILHGSMSVDERRQGIECFGAEGGVLIATVATMTEGVALPQVDTVILYDLPQTRSTLEQVYGRFQQLGRTAPVELLVMYNLDAADTGTAQALESLKAIVAAG